MIKKSALWPFYLIYVFLHASKTKCSIFIEFMRYLDEVLRLFPLLHFSLYPTLSGTTGRNYFSSSFSIRLQLVPGYSFLLVNDAADEFARRGALLQPSTVPCSFSFQACRIRSSLFSDWRCTVSSKFLDLLFPSVFTEELVLPRHACCVLSFPGTDTDFC